MMAVPPTRYARSGDARIAYQVIGDGPPDVVFVGGPASHLDIQWEDARSARNFRRLASFCRLIRFDRRGTGLSDPVEHVPTLEQQMDDLQAVLDAVGAREVSLMALLEVGLCSMYAASHPERVSSLILVNVAVSGQRLIEPERRAAMLDLVENHWGEGGFAAFYAPSHMQDPRFMEWWKRFERSAASPLLARKLIDMALQSDLRGVLPAIRVPTLVVQQTGAAIVPDAAGREVAALIPGARFVDVPGTDPYHFPDADDPVTDEIEEFLTGRRRLREPERVLATVLFTDIVGSTDRAAELGDREWHELLDRHDALVRERLEAFRGNEIKTIGDGFLATFDGPARAVRCAREITDAVSEIGLQVRCGLHTGECEFRNGDVSGIAVHIASRVCGLATAGCVLVSGTVKDLVVGSELRFDDRNVHKLRGVPGEWRLFALAA